MGLVRVYSANTNSVSILFDALREGGIPSVACLLGLQSSVGDGWIFLGGWLLGSVGPSLTWCENHGYLGNLLQGGWESSQASCNKIFFLVITAVCIHVFHN